MVLVQSADGVEDIAAAASADERGGVALDADDLSGVREVEIAFELRTGPHVTDFQTAATFIEGGMLRGETLLS
jgi:hypothetical protein